MIVSAYIGAPQQRETPSSGGWGLCHPRTDPNCSSSAHVFWLAAVDHETLAASRPAMSMA